MKNWLTMIKKTDPRFWIGMVTTGVGISLSLVGAYKDGVNDVIRAAEKYNEDEAAKEVTA